MSCACRPIALVLLLASFAAACRTAPVTTEEKIIDGIAVRVTSGGEERRWTRFDVAQPVPVARGGAIPEGSVMRRAGYSSPLPGLRAFVLKRNTQFGDVSCRGFFEFDTYFDAAWNLRVCPLNGDHVIDGVPCMGTSVSSWRKARRESGTDPAAVFYASGRLQKCIASRAFERAGVSYEEWQVVRLTEDGAPDR